jgi:hypothetical protein
MNQNLSNNGQSIPGVSKQAGVVDIVLDDTVDVAEELILLVVDMTVVLEAYKFDVGFVDPVWTPDEV